MYRLTIFNLSVKFETDDYILINHINRFLEINYTTNNKSFSKFVNQRPKVYASRIANSNIFYFHINQFLHLYNYLDLIKYPIKLTEKIYQKDYKIEECFFKVRDGWVPREDQIPVIDFLLNKPEKSKLVPLQTGFGKTSIALFALAKLQYRIGILILPTFIEKWVSDILTVHDTTPDKIMVIQGSKSLRLLVELAKEDNLESHYIIFSSRTLQEYITVFEDDRDLALEMYGIEPIELFPLLGIGVLLIDESHMHYHAVYKILLHSNIKYHIGMTATLISDDAIVRRMHNTVYPKECIYETTNYDRYAYVYPISYTIQPNNLKLIKTVNFGNTNYSHTAYEQSIIKHSHLLDKYIKLIKTIIEDYYLEDYLEKDKLVIFVSLVNMATILTERFQKDYPNKKVIRYVEEDSYEEMLTGDIIISTPTSLSVGIDIPNLRVAIMTVNISSTPTNLQSLGRLRKLKDRNVSFCYLYASNINKHREYSLKRCEIFQDKVKNIIHRASPVGL